MELIIINIGLHSGIFSEGLIASPCFEHSVLGGNYQPEFEPEPEGVLAES